MKLIGSSQRILTAESLVVITGKKTPVAAPCDLDGKPLPSNFAPYGVYDDVTGKPWVCVVAVMPSNTDPASVSLRESYEKMNPVHVDSDGIRGWFIPAPDFSLEG